MRAAKVLLRPRFSVVLVTQLLAAGAEPLLAQPPGPVQPGERVRVVRSGDHPIVEGIGLGVPAAHESDAVGGFDEIPEGRRQLSRGAGAAIGGAVGLGFGVGLAAVLRELGRDGHPPELRPFFGAQGALLGAIIGWNVTGSGDQETSPRVALGWTGGAVSIAIRAPLR